MIKEVIKISDFQ